MTPHRAMVAALAMATALVTGCADDSPPSPGPIASPGGTATGAPPSSSETSPPTSNAVAISTAVVRLRDYAIEPASLRAVAGRVTIEAANDDGVPHDVTLLRTALAPDALPTAGIRVDEVDPSIEIVGRTPRLSGGHSSSLTVTLEPGTYVLVCTVPHHYVREAMVATLTVTS